MGNNKKSNEENLDLVDSIEDSDLAELFEGVEDIEQMKEVTRDIENGVIRKRIMNKIDEFEEELNGDEIDSESLIEIEVDDI